MSNEAPQTTTLNTTHSAEVTSSNVNTLLMYQSEEDQENDLCYVGVVFKSNPTNIYLYKQKVTTEAFNALVNAESVGQALSESFIKPKVPFLHLDFDLCVPTVTLENEALIVTSE